MESRESFELSEGEEILVEPTPLEESMRTLGGAPEVPAPPPFRIKEPLPGRQNPTPKATDEKGNPKHWVKKRIEVRAYVRGSRRGCTAKGQVA